MTPLKSEISDLKYTRVPGAMPSGAGGAVGMPNVRRSLLASSPLLFICLLFSIHYSLLPLTARAQTTSPSPADLTPTLLIVTGAEGDPEFADVFTATANRWVDAAQKAHARYTLIGTASATRPAVESAASQPTEKQQLLSFLSAQPKDGNAQLWIIFIGHGTFDGREAKLNLRGPDLSATELAEVLKPFSRPLALLDCTSASAPFLTKLSVKTANRVIITATRAGSEIYYARFGMFLSQSIIDQGSADLDKDGQVSLLEAFLAASHRTAEFYKTENRLATEHALLDDNGDALGIPADFFEGVRAAKSARQNAPLDGLRAHQWILLKTPEELALPPALVEQRNNLEQQLESLRRQKPTLPEAAYYARLDPLLLQLARLYAQAPATQPAASQPSFNN